MPKSKRSFSVASRRDIRLAVFLIAPTLAVLVGLSIYPLIYSVTISLQKENSDGVSWGLSNFTRLVSDNFFLTALLHTFVFTIAALVLEFLIGLGLALLLNQQIRARG